MDASKTISRACEGKSRGKARKKYSRLNADSPVSSRSLDDLLDLSSNSLSLNIREEICSQSQEERRDERGQGRERTSVTTF